MAIAERWEGDVPAASPIKKNHFSQPRRQWRALNHSLFRRCGCRESQGSATQGAFFHQRKEDRYKNQNMYGGCNHSADDWRGDGLHYIRTDSGLPENWDEAREDCGYGHELRAQTLHGTFDRCGFDILMFERKA